MEVLGRWVRWGIEVGEGMGMGGMEGGMGWGRERGGAGRGVSGGRRGG